MDQRIGILLRVYPPEYPCHYRNSRQDGNRDMPGNHLTGYQVYPSQDEGQGRHFTYGTGGDPQEHLLCRGNAGTEGTHGFPKLHPLLNKPQGCGAGNGIYQGGVVLNRRGPEGHLDGKGHQQEYPPDQGRVKDVVSDATERELGYAYGDQAADQYHPYRKAGGEVFTYARVQRILVEDGAMVEAGDMIAVLSNTNLQLEVLGREAAVTEQLNNMRTIELQLEQNRLAHKRNLVEIDYQIIRLNRSIERQRDLARQNLVSKSTVDELQDELDYYMNRREVTLESQATDARLLTLIEEATRLIDRLTGWFFEPRDATYRLDGRGTPSIEPPARSGCLRRRRPVRGG